MRCLCACVVHVIGMKHQQVTVTNLVFPIFLGIIKISVAIEKHYQMTDMQILLIVILDYFCRVPITYIKMINGNQCNNFL